MGFISTLNLCLAYQPSQYTVTIGSVFCGRNVPTFKKNRRTSCKGSLTVDGILIINKTERDHVRQLEQVPNKLEYARLRQQERVLCYDECEEYGPLC